MSMLLLFLLLSCSPHTDTQGRPTSGIPQVDLTLPDATTQHVYEVQVSETRDPLQQDRRSLLLCTAAVLARPSEQRCAAPTMLAARPRAAAAAAAAAAATTAAAVVLFRHDDTVWLTFLSYYRPPDGDADVPGDADALMEVLSGLLG